MRHRSKRGVGGGGGDSGDASLPLSSQRPSVVTWLSGFFGNI